MPRSKALHTEEEIKAAHRETARRYREKHPDRVKASRRKYQETHRDERLEGAREWRQANPEKMYAARRRWVEEHRERHRATRNAWHAEHRERISEDRRRRYAENIEERRAKARAKRVEQKQALVARMGGKCVDCGQVPHLAAFEFDHVRGTKHTNVCALLGQKWERLLAEAEKCELVCANCHRIRTAERTGYV